MSPSNVANMSMQVYRFGSVAGERSESNSRTCQAIRVDLGSVESIQASCFGFGEERELEMSTYKFQKLRISCSSFKARDRGPC